MGQERQRLLGGRKKNEPPKKRGRGSKSESSGPKYSERERERAK